MTMQQTAIRLLAAHALPHLSHALQQTATERGDVHVVGTCRDWRQALTLAEELRPDVLSLDVALPGLPGPAAIGRLITEERQRVIVSATAGCGFTEDVVACLESGVVDFACRRPEHSWTSPAFLNSLLDRVCLAARVPMPSLHPSRIPALGAALAAAPGDLWVLSGDVGAAETVARTLPHLPADTNAALCIALSLPAPITRALAHYLDARCALPVQEARQGDYLLPGRVLVLPGNVTAWLRPARDGRPTLWMQPRRPGPDNINPLNRILNALAEGTRTHLVLLSGTGQDTIEGAAAVRAGGGHVLVAAPECNLLSDLGDAVCARGLAEGRLPSRPARDLAPRYRESVVAA